MKKIATLLLLSITLFSCKKDNQEEVPQAPITLKRPLGTPLGNEVTATIGAAGGTLQSADGNVRISIPAGAVNNATEFSIQQVTNSLGTKGFSYRLKPENIPFLKPVTIVYYYGVSI